MRKRQLLQPTANPQKKKKKLRVSIYSIVRIGFQILFFIWMPSLYISAFAGLQILFASLVTGTFSLPALWTELIPLAAVVPLTILAGRFFCGWMCAFGALTDWIYRVFSRWTKNRIVISGKADFYLKGLKYAVLAALLALGWLAGSISVSAMSPWDAFGMLFTVGAAPALMLVLSSLLPGFVLLVLILLASAFFERFFCRYLCPMGAIFALTSAARLIRIDKPRTNCGACKICTKNCAMGIPLNKLDEVKSGECIACMKCVDACPRKNITVQTAKIKFAPIAIAVFMAALITGGFVLASSFANSTDMSLNTNSGDTLASSDITNMDASGTGAAGSSESSTGDPTTSAGASSGADTSAAAGSSSSAVSSGTSNSHPASSTAAAGASATSPATKSSAAPTTSATTAAGLYKDGTYQGSGTGFRGTTTVSVTVKNGKISNISVLSFKDDAQYFNKAFPTISSSVISRQNPAADIVSHATYSSKGIIAAIKNALSKA